jgi:hypothetical protein
VTVSRERAKTNQCLNSIVFAGVVSPLVFVVACTKSSPHLSTTVTSTITRTVTASPVSGSSQVVPESCGPLLYGADGNFGNAICKDGRPNVQAVDLFRQGHSLTIDLDPNATPFQVSAALCHDNTASGLTNPLRQTLYNVASALNRWHFAIDILDRNGGINC